MKLEMITCSDPREDTSPEKLVAFMNEFPNVEVAVQATPSKIAPGLPRRAWFEQLLPLVRNNPRPLNLAMHVNMEYCNDMCCGNIPDDIAHWFGARRADGAPVIRRWQLNGAGSHTRFFDDYAVAKMIHDNRKREFIMQYNGGARTLSRIENLQCHGVWVPVLYDASGGNGILPDVYSKPFKFHKTGYSGGLSPENITGQLDKIAAVAGYAHIWIDAEGGLKIPGTKTFDIDRAREYVRAANSWNKKFGR